MYWLRKYLAGRPKKRMMLLNIIDHPSEEYFLHSSQQAKDFALLKKQCFSG